MNDQSICEYSESQMEMLNTLKEWVETQTEFYGRSDEDFLLWYLNGCKFRLEKAKQKIALFYTNKKKIPVWWTKRDISDPIFQYLMQYRAATLLIDKDPLLPSIGFVFGSRVGNVDHLFDYCTKYCSVLFEIGIRRRNCQMNGGFLVIDCAGYPFWVVKRALSPSLIYNVFQCYLAMPVRPRSVHIINTPKIAWTIWALVKPLLTTKLINKIHFYKSDWSQLYETIPLELLPEEYGGLAGPLSMHDEAFEKEINSYTEHFIEEDKYGFPTESQK